MPTEPFTLTRFMADGIMGAVMDHFMRHYPPVSVPKYTQSLAHNDCLAAMSYGLAQAARTEEYRRAANAALRQLNRDSIYKNFAELLPISVSDLLVQVRRSTVPPQDLVYAVLGHVLETELAMNALINKPGDGDYLDLTCEPGSTGAILKRLEQFKERLATVLGFQASWTAAAERS